MGLQIVLWTVLVMSVTVLVVGCVEWLRGRSRNLALAGAINVALAVSMVAGNGHPVWHYACLVIGLALGTYGLITSRKMIRWRRPPIVFAGATILLILVTEFLRDGLVGTPRPIVLALASAAGASAALFIGSVFWYAGRMFIQHWGRHN